MQDKPITPEQYWASIEDPDELLTHLDKKITVYYDDLRETGLLNLWERSYRAYYGGRIASNTLNSAIFEGSRLTQSGRQGEKTRLKANHYRNLIRHVLQLTTSQKPDIQTRASNSDYKSQAQTILGNGLVDYYWREKNVGSTIKDTVEVSLIYGEGFVHNPWNPSAGQVYTTDETGQPIYEGDQEYIIHSPLDIIRDPSVVSEKQSTWKIVRSQENRWDVAAHNPATADHIIEASAINHENDDQPSFQLRGGNEPPNEDMIHVYTFYHDKTEALPQGRMVVFIKEIILFDGPLPYQRSPVRRVAGEQLLGTIYGYSVAYDLLGVQEGIDELHTILMSNNKTFGIQSLWIKDTDKVQVSQLGGGMRLLKSDEPPVPLQLTKSAPESYQYLDKLEKTAETLSGISATMRGQPEASLKSGAALALVVSQSIQFINNLEESVNRFIEEIGTDLITNLRDFSKTQRVANIIGESSRPFAKDFNADDLSEINRVVVEQTNPLSKTVAGKVEIATNLLQQGFIKTPDQYLMVLSTGRLDPAIEGSQNAMLNIRAENEELREGTPVQAIVTEDHAAHIREHKTIIENPEAKKDPQLITSTMAHIQEHLDLWRSADPAILMITGQQPPPPPAMPMGGPQNGPPSSPPPPPTSPHEAPESAQETLNDTNPIEEQAEGVHPAHMPNLPKGAPPETQAAYEKLKPPMS